MTMWESRKGVEDGGFDRERYSRDPGCAEGMDVEWDGSRSGGGPTRCARRDPPLGRWLRDDRVVPMREAKTHLSRLAAYANDSGESITVVRNGTPWFEMRPLAVNESGSRRR